MALNNTTNLILKVAAKTKVGLTAYSISGVAVSQNIKVKAKQLSYGNSTISNGFITVNNTTTVGTGVVTDSGTINQVETIPVSAIMPLNESVKIASITLSPAAGYEISKKPNVSFRKIIPGLKVFIKQTTTANVYDLICNIERDITEVDEAIIDLNYSSIKQPTVLTNTISKLYVGSLNIPTAGITREIKIYGAPKTPFELSVLDASDNSLIRNSEDTVVLPSGTKNAISSKLNSRGYYSYFQKFPRLPIILTTKVNVGGGVSNARQITFDSLTGVQVGDEIITSDTRGARLNEGETIKVSSIDSTYVCTLSKPVTLADNKVVQFRRSTSYKINLETTGTKGSSLSSIYPTYTMTQNIGTILTINATTANGAVQINGGSGGATYTTSFGKTKTASRRVQLVYTYTGKTFNVRAGRPTLDQIAITSGDAAISGNISFSGSGTSTFKLFLDLLIDYGTEDTVANLNIDQITT